MTNIKKKPKQTEMTKKRSSPMAPKQRTLYILKLASISLLHVKSEKKSSCKKPLQI